MDQQPFALVWYSGYLSEEKLTKPSLMSISGLGGVLPFASV